MYSPAASSMPANSPPQFTNFPFEKRPCRPTVSVNHEPNYAAKSFAGLLSAVIVIGFFWSMKL